MRTIKEAKRASAKEQAYYLNHYANMLADISRDFDNTPEPAISFISRSMCGTLYELTTALCYLYDADTFVPYKGNEDAMKAVSKLRNYNACIADMANGADLEELACNIETTVQSMEAFGEKLFA